MIRIALVGPGGIAARVAKGIHYAEQAELYAVCSRDQERAEYYRKQYGAEVCGTLEDILEDTKVDLMYICVPTPHHYPVIRTCLEKGKAVMCEKPMVLDQGQLRDLFVLAREKNCFLMEAQKGAFTPLIVKVLGLVEQGAIGKLRVIRAEYSARMGQEKRAWLLQGSGSGVSGDLGTYPICFAHRFARSNVVDFSTVSTASEQGTDWFLSANIRYANGIVANVVSSWYYTMGEQRGSAFLGGEAGYILILAFWKSNEAILVRDGKETRIAVDCPSEFTGEIEHAADCIRQGLIESPIMSMEMSSEILDIVLQGKSNVEPVHALL